MQGYDALWMPGTDHAGIATQAVVEKRLFAEEKKTRHDVGREALVDRIWAWKDEYEARILGQLRLMGCSCDWERTRFTLDEVCARAVRVTFFRLFQAGKIFRGKRLVNWDVQLRTAVADDEIEYQESDGHLWTISYPVTGSETEALHVSTTRPETMLGDTAVAVHPGDDRYAPLIGRTVTLPLIGREIPVIADPILVDPKFGTGCVKVTPAHDPNDYQTGLRHGLPQINLLNPDGSYNENAGPYAGLDRREVRKRVVADLDAQGLLIKTEPYKNRVGYSDRSKTPIEPYLSDQWFVRMADDPDGSPGFAQSAIDAVETDRVKIHPERYKKSYTDWLKEKRDWCISRQLWWGHRIPIWYCGTCTEQDLAIAFDGRSDVAWRRDEAGTGWLICAESNLEPDALGGAHTLQRDPDVLDTWFSSALWPHSTLGWPEATPELAKYYPTSVLSTARDIITLWVARMVIFGQFNNNGEVPFQDVFIHPVIQDGEGRRMSKSLGNGIDPVDIIELYGVDVLRYSLAAATTETQDLRMPVEQATLPDGRTVNTSKRFEEGRTFPNKFWNAARFALLNLEGYNPGPIDPAELAVEDRWILSLLRRAAEESTAALGSFRFADLAKGLRDFTWGEFCDWYVEFIKHRLRDDSSRAVAQRVPGGGARRPLPAAAPDHAVRHRVGLAGPWRRRPVARRPRADRGRPERLHRPLAQLSRGLGRPRGRIRRDAVAGEDRRPPEPPGRARRAEERQDRAGPGRPGPGRRDPPPGRPLHRVPLGGRFDQGRGFGRSSRGVRRRGTCRHRDHPADGRPDRPEGRMRLALEIARRASEATRRHPRQARQRGVRLPGPGRGRRPAAGPAPGAGGAGLGRLLEARRTRLRRLSLRAASLDSLTVRGAARMIALQREHRAGDTRRTSAESAGTTRERDSGAFAVAVQMALARIIISETGEQQIIYLREVGGDRTFPIVIGFFEATSIDRRVRGVTMPRPLTHDLLAKSIEQLGGEIQDIYINDLRDHTYFAQLRIRHDGELIEIDSRPSDAIAIAVTVDAPIFVSEEVIEEAGR